jgi:hypothetical protein
MGLQTSATEPSPESPADTIEQALAAAAEARRSSDTTRLPSILNQLAAGILSYHSIPRREWPSETRDGLFSSELSFVQNRFSSACLLRLLGCNPAAFAITPFRFQAYQLFDRTLAPDLYKRIKVDVKMQHHEKEEKLKDVVPSVEQALDGVLCSPMALDAVPAFRIALMKVVHNAYGQVILPPYLPKRDLDTLLKSVCDSTAAYLNAQPTDFLGSFATACQSLETTIAEAEAVHFWYSQHYIAEPLKSVLAGLRAHFTASPVHQSPSITAERSDKKYPFYLQNKEIDLEIDLENAGPGHAFDVSLSVAAITDVRPVHSTISIGDLNGPTRVRLPVRTVGSATDVALDLDIEWRRFDQTRESKQFMLLFLSQRSDINWASLSTAEPYDLEPVTTEAELIGRADFLNDLVSMVRGTSVGSAIIFGQKRVGKTSLVKTFANRLAKDFPAAYTIIYVEGGEYVRPDPVRTIEALASKLCEELRLADEKWASVATPAFDGAFAPFGDFVNQVLRATPNRRVIFILDEFDELPTDLYTHNNVADAFFLSLRSIGAKPNVGFVLVGSEKMQAILGLQGHELNKFKTIRVDYFDRQQHWGDFVDLVRRPAQDILEISDRAVSALYDYTAGNPYFTKLLCKSLFKAMVNRRDGHVTESEIIATVQNELRSVGVNSFLHFWEDGIVEKGDEHKRISETRQKTLLCYADVARRSKLLTVEQLKQAGSRFDLSEELVAQEIDDFVQRNVFLRDDAMIRVKVGFFAEWLRESGPRELLPYLGDRIATLERKREEAAYVRDDEIRTIVDAWKVYKGRRIAIEDVRRWLGQLGSNVEQRLMFKLLAKLRFFSEDQIRQRLATLQQMISRDVAFRYEGKVPRLRDIIISYLDSPGKSGFQYAKLYGEENKIYYENIQEPARALKSARGDNTVKALVFIDDFLGTGQSAISYLLGMRDELLELEKTRAIPVFLCVVAGFQEAANAIEQELGQKNMRLSVRIAEPLNDTDKAFSNQHGIFCDADECEKAKRLSSDLGARLEPKHPLGYGSSEALVVFERSCPNNTLPIIWSSSNNWAPLFKRL